MGVYANGHLIYGFVHTDDTEDLFEAISGANEDEAHCFDELHLDLQRKHGISLFSVGYEGIDILSAYSANVCCKGLDVTPINAEDLANSSAYHQKIRAFLQELGIDADKYTPGWHLLSYMD